MIKSLLQGSVRHSFHTMLFFRGLYRILHYRANHEEEEQHLQRAGINFTFCPLLTSLCRKAIIRATEEFINTLAFTENDVIKLNKCAYTVDLRNLIRSHLNPIPCKRGLRPCLHSTGTVLTRYKVVTVQEYLHCSRTK